MFLNPGDKLLLATHNHEKVREITPFLQTFNFNIVIATDLGIPEPEETEDSFTGNALLKARFCSNYSKLPALADDSGLCVDALNGSPGIYSARWAGPNKDFYAAMAKVERLMVDTLNRKAHFICALALVLPDGEEQVFMARIDGTISMSPKGQYGLGYDPIFIPEGHDQTFGEMLPHIKDQISHRTKAINQLTEYLNRFHC